MFLDKAFDMKHRQPTTELERVLLRYSWANSGEVLDIVLDNWQVLRKAGLLEEAFIEAWSTQKHGSHNWTMPFCNEVFALLDRTALLKAADPLPTGESFTVYRGVAGIGSKRRVYGYSWSNDVEIARLFARLRGLPKPAVFRATIQREHVLAYIDTCGRNEKEFLLMPHKLTEVRLHERMYAAN